MRILIWVTTKWVEETSFPTVYKGKFVLLLFFFIYKSIISNKSLCYLSNSKDNSKQIKKKKTKSSY